MDGALVNPVPVTAARALGADVVVCVNLNGEGGGRGTTIQSHAADPDPEGEVLAEADAARGWLAPVRDAANRLKALGLIAARCCACAWPCRRDGRCLQHHAGSHCPLAARR